MCDSNRDSFIGGLASGVVICIILSMVSCTDKLEQERFMRDSLNKCLPKEQINVK